MVASTRIDDPSSTPRRRALYGRRTTGTRSASLGSCPGPVTLWSCCVLGATQLYPRLQGSRGVTELLMSYRTGRCVQNTGSLKVILDIQL